jgi:hypothetical protein
MDKEITIQQINDIIPIGFNFEWVSSGYERNNYRITLQTEHGKQTFPYFQGYGVNDEPDLVSVLYCLLLDAACYDDYGDDIDEFMNAFGDTRQVAKTMIKDLKRNKEKLEKLGIIDYTEELIEVLEESY